MFLGGGGGSAQRANQKFSLRISISPFVSLHLYLPVAADNPNSGQKSI